MWLALSKILSQDTFFSSEVRFSKPMAYCIGHRTRTEYCGVVLVVFILFLSIFLLVCCSFLFSFFIWVATPVTALLQVVIISQTSLQAFSRPCCLTLALHLAPKILHLPSIILLMLHKVASLIVSLLSFLHGFVALCIFG